MTVPATTEKPVTSLTQDLARAGRYYLGGRRGLILLAAIAVGGGLAFNWSWLVAAGIAPILISLAPCAAMCAIGVCCLKKTSGAAGSDGSAEDGPEKKPDPGRGPDTE